MSRTSASIDYQGASEAVAAAYGRDPDFVIPMLQDLQREFGYIPPEAAICMARLLGIPLSQLYAVATFYSSLRLTPCGDHVITLCMGTVCYLKGSNKLAARIQESLNVGPGGTTADGRFTFQPMNCLGACGLAPVLVVDDTYFTEVKPVHVPDIIARYARKDDAARDVR